MSFSVHLRPINVYPSSSYIGASYARFVVRFQLSDGGGFSFIILSSLTVTEVVR